MALKIQHNVPLSSYTTFRIGGPAAYFAEVETVEEMREALKFAKTKSLPFLILGRGSNSLFSDKGFSGVVILNKLSQLEQQGEKFKVGSGYSFSLLGTKTARLGFSGLEFASGIPGSVGGAVWMNAGANGCETKDRLIEVEFMNEEGTILLFKQSELVFSYRTSPFQKMEGAILSSTFLLERSEGARSRQIELIEKRKKSQPLKEASAGCVFRNPKEKAAGALIEESGLKGFSIGGAEVSTLHANFILNRGNATADDVLKLAALIQLRVKEKTGVDLELELHRIVDV